MYDAWDLPLPPPPARIIDLLVRGKNMLIQWNLFPNKNMENCILKSLPTVLQFKAPQKVPCLPQNSRVSKQQFPGHHFFQQHGQGFLAKFSGKNCHRSHVKNHLRREVLHHCFSAQQQQRDVCVKMWDKQPALIGCQDYQGIYIIRNTT